MLSYSVVTGRIEHLFGETRHIDFINKLAQDSTVASDLFVFFWGGGERGGKQLKRKSNCPRLSSEKNQGEYFTRKCM